ncbi:hypothetical protein [Spirosoma utsteinense]|uniref:P pilus assembly/Cpx signaling pathway, periplasmic inhibitor/zinc-resistance associated protein n=1 Tax=Spirosoma utsteinense TaxID=2585773 RepID=A0ABR6VZ08_9BACT|nr:hypothetical protein [Spirosoma utsteinense]MBC3784722.1 hypothetical protein [Spirosoma utsteinense]MBC3789524.1 hypothetical protein [Spirosoma utsteinense]
MKRAHLIFVFSLLASVTSYGQYGGQYGGGMGGRQGMGGGQFSQPSGGSRSSAFSNMPGVLAERETKWLRDSLSLTKEQTKSVKKVNNEFAKQQQEAIKDIVGTSTERPSPQTMDQIRETMLMINEEKEDNLKPILTPEQWKLYKSKKESMRKSTGGFQPKVATKVP